MAVLLKNYAWGNVKVAVETTDDTVEINGNQSDRFPVLPADSGNWYYATLTDSEGNEEIVKCTKRVGAVFTVVRAQGGTTARRFVANSYFSMRLNAEVFDDFIHDHELAASENTIDGKLQALVDALNAIA